MDNNDKLGLGQPFDFNELNVQKLKDKYSKEMKDDAENPIKICVKQIFNAAMERDPNKRIELSYELSKFLIKPDGVINLFLALIDFDTSSQKVTTHNQRFIAVSNIITCLPKLCVPYEQYCDKISKQLTTFLVSNNPKYSSLASIIVKSMLDSPHARGKDIPAIILNPICQALSSPTNASMKPNEAIIAIHHLIQNYVPTSLFTNNFTNLYYALATLIKTPSNLKVPLRRVLISILNDLKPGPACCLIEETIFFNRSKRTKYDFEAQESGITLRVKEGADDNLDYNDMRLAIMAILEHCHNERMVLEFFFHFQAKMLTCDDDDQRQQYAYLVEPFVELLDESKENERTSKIDLLSSIATNSEFAVELISRTLLNYLDNLRLCRDGLENNLVLSSLSNCLNILEVLSMGHPIERHHEVYQCNILPILIEMKSILETSDKSKLDKLKNSLDSLIEKLTQEHSVSEVTNESEKIFNEAMADLNDKLVPVRVHALVRFKQMMIANDPFAISKIPQLFSLIESSLADQEPYVFLACINLLSEMSVRQTKELLPKLVELYSNRDFDIQQRINVGEVLVRLTRQMNKTTPYYAQQVMNILLKGTRDTEELIRMSSLTNMGEICRYLGDSLGKYIVDIITCVSEVIATDSIPAKCAAIDLLRSALMGLDKFTAESIQTELKSIYGLLKTLKSKTLDDGLCVQVGLALDEIDRLAKEMLGISAPQQQSGDERDRLVKNIKVLSMFDR